MNKNKEREVFKYFMGLEETIVFQTHSESGFLSPQTETAETLEDSEKT